MKSFEQISEDAAEIIATWPEWKQRTLMVQNEAKCKEREPVKQTDTDTLVQALRILARDIESGDGVANDTIREAADRIETLLNSLASPSFRCLRNYGDRWGISHVSFDGVSIGEIFDASFDRLLQTWVELNEAIELHRQGDQSDDHRHDWHRSIDGGTEICKCGAWR